MSMEQEQQQQQEKPKERHAGPGVRLREARKAAGFSIEEVAKHLRLTSRLIKQIECDDYSHATKFVFVRGYLRGFASMVTLDADEIVHSFNSMNLQETPSNRPTWQLTTREFDRPRINQKMLLSLGITVSIVILFMIFWHSQHRTQLVSNPIPLIKTTQQAPEKTTHNVVIKTKTSSQIERIETAADQALAEIKQIHINRREGI